MQVFFTFMAISGFVWWPKLLLEIKEQHLLRFVAHCYQPLHFKHTTVRSYLCGIRFTYLRHGTHNPRSTGWMLSLDTIMSAVKKIQAVQKYTWLPITINIVCVLCSVLTDGLFTPYTDFLMKAVCSLGFFTLLRCGEFTPHRDLAMDSIVFAHDNSHFELNRRQSKTDPMCLGITLAIFAVNKPSFAVKCMQENLAARRQSGTTAKDPLFVTQDNVPLGGAYYIKHFKLTLTVCGFDADLFNGHSLRIGTTTSAA